ncbi:MAG: cob(I)yrinic acid a,c-diamide adenosyltransferase [Gammaproteobacteria bacterium]
MSNRLTKIYTRTGDDGTTGLGDGTRVAKDHASIEAIGAVDELNCALGVLLTHELPAGIREPLTVVQHELFDVGGELCLPGRTVITQAQVDGLEELLDALNGELPALQEFILPGGSPAAAACHLARAMCRRAERRTFSLAKESPVNRTTLQYLNRLSDLLFVIARHLNKAAGVADVLWKHERR